MRGDADQTHFERTGVRVVFPVWHYMLWGNTIALNVPNLSWVHFSNVEQNQNTKQQKKGRPEDRPKVQ